MFANYRLIHPSQISVFFDTDQSVITKITRDAKRTWSDKISWVSFVFLFVDLFKLFVQIGGNMGLFTGFSVISGIEIIYWIWFKVLLLQAPIGFS